MSSARRLLPLVLLVTLASAGVRSINNLRVADLPERGGREAWFCFDPDSLYHMRRLEGALEHGGYVAPRDPLLDYPRSGGAAIPWPGGYTRVLWLLAAPFAPSGAVARKRFVEHWVASAPLIWAALASAVVALAAGRLGGRTAAAVAGLSHAFTFASLRYSYLGMGDHHAWTSLLHVVWLAAASEGLRRRGVGSGGRRRAGFGWGALAGLAAGLSLAAWVPTLIALALFELALALIVLRRGREIGEELAPFAVAFHAFALVSLLPEVLASPWPVTSLVTLSPLHALALVPGLALGLLLWSFPAAGRAGVASIAITIPLALLLAGGLAGGSLGEAWAWLTARDPFMAYIRESQPLGGDLLRWLGYSSLLVLPAWLWLWRGAAEERLPWLVALPALAGMALVQRRFAEGLAAPAAWTLGLFAAGALEALSRPHLRRALAPLLVFAAVAAHPGVVRTSWNRARVGLYWYDSPRLAEERAEREACRWLAEREGEGAVLAQWDLGHLIEWVAARPTLATNFGGYLGERWLDPWRVLTAQDEERALEVMDARGARFLLLTASWRRNRVPMARLDARLDTSLAARLVPRDEPGRDPSLDDPTGLRRVYRGEGVWIYERVRGARIVVEGEPGQTLRVSLNVPEGEGELEWSSEVRLGPEGRGELRVPYGTSARPARWYLAGRHGEIPIPEEAVRLGKELRLP